MALSHREVLSRRFRGESVKEIAGKTGASEATVYSRIKDFKNEVEEVGLMVAARKYGVEPTVQQLIRLSEEARKNDISVGECVKGSKIIKTLKALNVKPTDYQAFTETVYLESKNQDMDGSELVRYTNELKTLSREMGVSYREVPQRLRSENEKSQELKAENEKLQREIQINQRTVRHELGQKKTTLEQLNEFVHVRDELKKWNFDIQNLVDTRNLLENVEKLGHDPKAVVETFSKHQLVETNLKTLQKQEQELSETMKNQRMENESLQETLDDNRELVDEVEQLKHHNIGPQTVVDLLKTAIKIGAEHGLTEPEAIEKFMKDTKTHYDPILGHEERLDTLNAIINMVEKKLAQKEEENRSLTEIVDQRREALDCLQTIQNLGVKDEELVEWKNILEENRYDVAGFREEINKLNGIERLAEEKTRRVRDLEYRIEQLTTVRTFTENEAIGAREDLANRFNELSQTVQKEIDKVNDLMNRFEEDFTSEDTGYLARSKAIIEDTHGKVSSLLIKTEEKWREDVDRLNEDTDRIVENVDFILQNAYKGGKIVGRFHSLEPINKLISGETQPYFQTVLAVFTLMTYIMKWFDDNNKMSLIEPGNKIIDHLSRELGAANP